jgi:hypothetical protein
MATGGTGGGAGGGAGGSGSGKPPVTPADRDLSGKPRDYEKKVEARYKDMSLDDYASKIKVDETLTDAVRITQDKYGDAKVELRRSSELGDLTRKIDSLHADKERILSRSNPDQKQVDKINKELEALGKKAQREVHEITTDLDSYSKEFSKAHDEAMYNLKSKRDEVTEAIKSIEHEGKKGKGYKFSIDENLSKSLQVKTKEGVYKINTDGNIEAISGKAVNKLDTDQLKAIKTEAIDRVEKHYNAQIDARDTLHNKHQEALTKARDHVHGEDVKGKINSKTGAGEYVAGKSSVTSPGGAQALEKGVIGEKAYKDLGTLGKIGADIKANYKSGWTGTIKVGVGAIGVADGIRRAVSGVSGMMSSDPEKQDAAGFGSVVVGGVEAAAALALMRHTGAAKAMGH